MMYLTRSDWAARPPKRPLHTIKPTELLFVHHAAGYRNGGPSAIRAIQRLHQDEKGWNDIAYNWLVDDTGAIFEGRGWFKAGGATKGWNTWSISICYVGNAELYRPTEAALSGIAAVGAEAERLMGPQQWRPHNSVSATLCPGAHLLKWLGDGRPVEGDEMAMAWQDEVAFDLGIISKYETTGPNKRTPTYDERSYWLGRYTNGDDPAWLLAACAEGLSKEEPK
jgi:hypothetical protein